MRGLQDFLYRRRRLHPRRPARLLASLALGGKARPSPSSTPQPRAPPSELASDVAGGSSEVGSQPLPWLCGRAVACRPSLVCACVRAFCVTPSDRKRSRAGRCYFFTVSASGGATAGGAASGATTSPSPHALARARAPPPSCLAARAVAAHALAACALTARIAGGHHRAARAARWRVRRDDFALTARPRCRALICGKKCRVYVVVFCVVLVSVRVACVYLTPPTPLCTRVCVV